MQTETIGINMAVRRFEAAVINQINGNGLPATVTLLVLKDITAEMEKEAARATNREIEEYNQRKEKEHGQSDNSNTMGEQPIGADAAGPDKAK